MKNTILVLTILAIFLMGIPTPSLAVTLGDTGMEIIPADQQTRQNSSVNLLSPNESGQAIDNTESITQIESITNTSYSVDNIEAISNLLQKEYQPIRNKEKKVSDKGSAPTTPSNMKLEEPIVTKERFTEDEIDLLARIVRAEAQTEPFEGKVAVACVVLNRLESPKFPDTIKEVIYAPNQFQPVKNGQINKPADESSIKAVHTALTDHDHVAGESLFFYNPDIATSRWLDSRDTTVVIGDHVFKK